MAKLWNVGGGAGDGAVPTVKRRDIDGKVKEFVKVPAMHAGHDNEFIEHKPGNVYLSLYGFGFYTIPKDAPFDVPPGASAKAVMEMCPHLVSQEEYESMAAPASGDDPKPEPKLKKQDKLTQ